MQFLRPFPAPWEDSEEAEKGRSLKSRTGSAVLGLERAVQLSGLLSIGGAKGSSLLEHPSAQDLLGGKDSWVSPCYQQGDYLEMRNAVMQTRGRFPAATATEKKEHYNKIEVFTQHIAVCSQLQAFK